MAIKYAQEIAQEIQERGAVVMPPKAVTGDAFEHWLYEEDTDLAVYEMIQMPEYTNNNEFVVSYYAGEVA